MFKFQKGKNTRGKRVFRLWHWHQTPLGLVRLSGLGCEAASSAGDVFLGGGGRKPGSELRFLDAGCGLRP